MSSRSLETDNASRPAPQHWMNWSRAFEDPVVCDLHYCFNPVQLPTHPSERRNVPEPLRPDRRPDMVHVMPPTAPTPEVEPFGLTWAVPYCPTILLPLIITVSENVPQGVPTLVRTHAPSRLLPPVSFPPPFRNARRGSSASALLPRDGFEAVCGAPREPDSDFSSLPMLPPNAAGLCQSNAWADR